MPFTRFSWTCHVYGPSAALIFLRWTLIVVAAEGLFWCIEMYPRAVHDCGVQGNCATKYFTPTFLAGAGVGAGAGTCVGGFVAWALHTLARASRPMATRANMASCAWAPVVLESGAAVVCNSL